VRQIVWITALYSLSVCLTAIVFAVVSLIWFDGGVLRVFDVDNPWRATVLLALFIGKATAPAFVVLRAVLYLARLDQWYAFAVAGGLAAFLAQWMMFPHWAADPDLLVIGGIGGVIVWGLERMLPGIAIRAGAGVAE
jgi:hypothetical protein